MTTQKQTVANHLNAQQSTGPISVEGKTVVAKNALKHGIFSKQILLEGKFKKDFESLRMNSTNNLALKVF